MSETHRIPVGRSTLGVRVLQHQRPGSLEAEAAVGHLPVVQEIVFL
jgi:hypothetical protein